MVCLRLTLLHPKQGAAQDVQALLEEIDRALSGSRGLLLSFVTSGQSDSLGRVAVWRTKEEANRKATSDHILALRSRLRFLSHDIQEVLIDVKPGVSTEDLVSVFRAEGAGASNPDIQATEVA